MTRIGSTVKQGTTTRRINRIAERIRITNLDQQKERVRENQRNENPIGPQREQERNNDIDYDKVSVHTSQTSSTEEEIQRSGDTGRIEGNDENMTLAELRQRLIAERQREGEERANLIRQNDELREYNLRLQEQRSRSATRSRSRSSRSSSRQSRSNQEDTRRRQCMEEIEENMQVDDNPQDQQRRRDVAQDLGTNQYEHPRELLHRTHNNFER
ncbi:uncharacterized protein T05G5.1-like [Papaver somniferum]|uniref:uncharacterized protein T05G5.1-like n=1 Tax=Papaver somniferum TaxID=3469 RepID=UPI000E7006EE|nr:uncharacterized protein T05G5.1-like [Papaver somniferum]